MSNLDTSSLSDQLNTAVNTAPELTKSPGVAVGIASAGGNIQQNAQATARASNLVSDVNAHQSVSQSIGESEVTKGLNWFANSVIAPVSQAGSDTIHSLQQVGSAVLNTANKPLQFVQHEYRYLHDVEARHGYGAALVEGLGIAGGAVAGGMAGGFYGAELGAEAATALEGQIMYRDSWQRTASSSYADPHTNQQVSIGRDLASVIGDVPGLEMTRGTLPFKITSGVIDGIFDMNLGGGEALGIMGKAKSAEGMVGTLGSLMPGKAPQTTEAFDNLLSSYAGGDVRRAFADIASKNAGEIAATYKPLSQQAALLRTLGDAQTPDEVANVFRDIIRTHEMVYFDKLPTMSITRAPFQWAHEAMGESNIPGVQRLYRATTRLPETFDSVHQTWTRSEVNPVGEDDGTLFYYRTALYTEKPRTAALMASEYNSLTDPMDKITALRNLYQSTLVNMAGFRGSNMDEVLRQQIEDPAIRQQWAEGINRFLDVGMFGKDAHYGNAVGGQDISRVYDTLTGKSYAAGITMNQTGKIGALDLVAARRAAQQIAGYKKLFDVRGALGKIDDLAFDHFTAPVFKRNVLLSPSYAFHISLAELIPNSLRLGVFHMVRSRLDLSAAKLGEKVSDDEVSAVSGLVWKLLKGARYATHGLQANPTERDLQYATDFVDDFSRMKGLLSGHNLQEEIATREAKGKQFMRGSYFDTPSRLKSSNDFGNFGSGEAQFNDAWQQRLHESANDGASKFAATKILEGLRGNGSSLAENGPNVDRTYQNAVQQVAQYIRDMSPEERGMMVRSKDHFTHIPPPAGTDLTLADGRTPLWQAESGPDSWARIIVENVRGLTTGANGAIHTNLLEQIRDGHIVDDQLLHDIPDHAKPTMVSGRRMVPDGTGFMAKFANGAFEKVLNPMVNFMSREPIAMAEYSKQRGVLEKAVQEGLMTEDEARVQASVLTVQNVMKNVHNLTDRTQWTDTFRNWAPFYFAQEQAYRRMGRLMAENPRAFRQYQLMITNMHNLGQVFQGPNGNGYFVMPGTGFLTSGVVKALHAMGVPVEAATPIGMGWNVTSSSVIFPLSAGFRPDIGPAVAIPLSQMAANFPEFLSPVLKADFSAGATTVLGPQASESVLAQLTPNTILQRLLTAKFPSYNSRAFNSTMMQTIATLDYEGRVPPPTASPEEFQTFLDRVKMQTRIMYIMKGLVGGVTPVSPEITNPTYNLFNAELAQDIKTTGSVSAGIQQFLSKNPDATPFTTFQSSNEQGVSIPASVEAEKWINDNLAMIRKYPAAGLLMMPMNMPSTYNAAVYNEQIAQGLRTKWTAGNISPNGQLQGFLAQLYTQAGDSIVFKWLSQFEQQISTMSGSEKYTAEQNFYGNGTLGSGTLGKYGQQNPIWWQSWQDNYKSIQREQAISQMTQLLNSPDAPQTPIANDTRALLQGYQNYQNQLSNLATQRAPSSLVTDAKNAWKAYLVNLVDTNPNLTNVVTGLFMSVPSQVAATTVPSGTPGVFSAQSWNKAS